MQNPNFLSREDVIRIHDELVSKAGQPLEIFNETLLESCVSQPQVTWAGEFLYSTIYEQAAAYLFLIANNHTFLAGNKRTAFAVMVTFLNQNYYDITLTDEEAVRLTLQVSTHEVAQDTLSTILKSYIIKLE